MIRTQAPRPNHELSFGGVAPWPVSGALSMADIQADPAARCCRECGRRLLLLPALRQNQAITESMLLACADAALEHGSGKTGAGDVSRREIADFVHQVVSGDQQELTAAYETLARGAAAPAVLGLVKQSMFKAILDRLANNFVLWVMIPAGAPAAQGRGSRPGGHVTGLCDDAYGTYNFNWGYYLESLRLFAETGAGKPFQARVNQRNGGYRAGRPVN